MKDLLICILWGIIGTVAGTAAAYKAYAAQYVRCSEVSCIINFVSTEMAGCLIGFLAGFFLRAALLRRE